MDSHHGKLRQLFEYNFLEYTSYVIKERAIPDINDGLKPVQRRILQTLHNMDDADWVTSTAPIPFVTIGDGNWESNDTWNIGQNAPTTSWSRVMLKHNITLNENMELLDIVIETNAILNISTGNTLTVGED